MAGLDPVTLSFPAGLKIAGWSFVAASAVFFAYRKFFADPYAFVAASRNYRSL